MTKIGLMLASSAFALMATTGANAATQIFWWHAMGGELGAKLESIAAGFNASQSDWEVVPVYKGSYDEALTSAVAAFRANQQPHILQVYEVGTGTMMAAKGAVYPIHQLMADQGQHFDPNEYVQAVVGYYTDTEGQMLSLPFNPSTPIVYYNKDIFAKAGLDPEVPPATWAQMAEFSQKIIDSGAAKCGFTNGWTSWVHLENLHALHDQPFSTKENGFGGLDAEFTFNSELGIRHWENLAEWQKSGIYQFSEANAAPLFYAQECAIYMNSSAARAGVLDNAKDFAVGFAPLPYYDDVIDEPKNSIIGGATLWTLTGKPEGDYKGVAEFYTYLSSDAVQLDWHQYSGYLPIMNKTYEAGLASGFYAERPGSDVAIKQMDRGEPTANSKGVRFGNFVQVRAIILEEIEQIIGGSKTAKEGLDSAVERGNALLREFEAANS